MPLLTSCIIPHVAMVLPTLNCILYLFHALWYCNVPGMMVLFTSHRLSLIQGPIDQQGNTHPVAGACAVSGQPLLVTFL